MLVDVVDRDFLLHSGQCFIERDNVRCLGEAPRVIPAFGFKPKIPFRDGKSDRTEVDMKLGDLMVEAKLTEREYSRITLSDNTSTRSADVIVRNW